MARYPNLKSFIGLWVAVQLFPACALYSPGGNQQVVLTCGIPSDQTGTISGHWSVTPIPIAFHQGDFDANETAAMTAAADTWNSFYTASINLKTLDYGGAGSANTTASADDALGGNTLCANGDLLGSSYVGKIGIYKTGRWPAAYPANAMALTSFCTLPGASSSSTTSYPKIYKAVMEINYQNFFIQGTKLPDLQTIVLHELGHLHGLNHSCEAASKTGTPNCNDPNLNPDYASASMYPTFGFDSNGNGQQKRQLGTNDQSRANCLYGSAPAATSTTVTTGGSH